MFKNNLQELVQDATKPDRLIPALCSGFMIGLLNIIFQLSFATLIFSGPLAAFAPSAAGLTLFGACAMGLFVTLGSSYPGSIGHPQDAPAAILAAVAVGITSSLAVSADPHAAFVTVGAAMTLSTLASGILFLLMGRFRLGNLMRYMPYPVVGGFLAGIGWLLVQGGVSIMTGVSLSLADLPLLLTTGKLLRLAPGAALTLTLLVGMKRWKSVFTLPGVLAVSLGAFVLYLGLSGQSLAEAGKAGLLLGGLPDRAMLWPVFSLADLSLIRWDALVPQLPQLCTIPLVSAISFLLIESGVETAARRDLDLKHELYLSGFANLLAGLGGSHTGYTSLSLTMLGPKTGSDSRLVGLSAALLIGATTVFGAAVLGLFPRFILGGMVLFLGVATLLDWVVDARRQFTRVEYGLILAILCTIGLFGFLTGVGVGLVLATVVFVIKYSRLPVVRQDTDATALSSTRQRPVPDQHILRGQGRSIRILRVMGFLFFGSANILSRAAAAHLKPGPEPLPGHLLLDFTEADGFDSSAVNCFVRMLQRCAAAGCQVVFSATPPGLEEQMRRAAPQETDQAQFFPNLDRALEWCEDALLAQELASLEVRADATGRDRLFDLAVDDLLLQLEEGERFEALVERLGPHLEQRRALAGEVILRQGETPDGVYFIISGQAEEVFQDQAGATHRLRTLGPGDVAGQSAPERGCPAPGSLAALTDCALSFLPAQTLRRLEATDPALALAFYNLFTALLESRLAQPAKPRG